MKPGYVVFAVIGVALIILPNLLGAGIGIVGFCAALGGYLIGGVDTAMRLHALYRHRRDP